MLESTEAVYDNEQIRYLEQTLINKFNLPAIELMNRAGQSLFTYISKQWPQAKSLCVVCGGGNNAGDGYVVARLALLAGWQVQLYSVPQPSQLPSTAYAAYQVYCAAGGIVKPFVLELPHAALYLDALFGIGLNREAVGRYAMAINALNQCLTPVIAADIPSGLDANTGQVHGVAVKATATISFIALKIGLLTGRAAEYVGELHCDNLQLATELEQIAHPPCSRLLSKSYLHHILPKRVRYAHKGHFGHALLVGGALGMSGAIRLAAKAALRTGSGLVTVATRREHAAYLNIDCPELMVLGVDCAQQLLPLPNKTNAVAIGPGLGQAKWASELLAIILANKQPKVLDADALNLLAKRPIKRHDWILTPHPMEAARLLAVPLEEIEKDRIQAIQQLQAQYGGVIVLKGAGTLIADETQISCCIAGNPGMASGGMGDVLTGIIAACLAQQLPLYQAAQAGVLIHGLAGDLAAKQGERGMVASDLIQQIRMVVNP